MLHERVLKGPAIFESSMLLTYNQQFYRACSYSLTLWVWIWKSKSIENKETPIFTSRLSDPIYDQHESILPAIVFNVGIKRESYFFSAFKDSNGHYVGYWSEDEIKYHEWTHIALIITDTYIEGFVNGKSQNKAKLQNMGDPELCPYYGLDLHQTYHNFVNNTIFQVGGYRHGKSMVGMIQDLEIFRNTALNESEVKSIMNSHPPETSQLFKELLDINNIYTFDQYSPVKWHNDYFISLSLGLCPTWICGLICVEESFLLGTDMNSKLKLSSEAYPKDRFLPINKNILLKEELAYLADNFIQKSNHYDSTGIVDEYVDLIDSLDGYYKDNYQQYYYGDYDDVSLLEEEIGQLQQLLDTYANNDLIVDDLYNGYTFEEVKTFLESESGRSKIHRNKNMPHKIQQQKSKDLTNDITAENLPDTLSSNTTTTNSSLDRNENMTRSLQSYSYKSPLPKRFRSKVKSISSNSIVTYPLFLSRLQSTFTSLYENVDNILGGSLSSMYNQLSFQNVTDSNNGSEPHLLSNDTSNNHYSNSSNSSNNDGSGKSNTGSSHQTIHNYNDIDIDDDDDDDIEYHMLSKADRVKRLYTSAMLWLNGRHERMSIEATLPLNLWVSNATQNSFTALCFALWLADDLSVSTDMDVEWFVRYPSSLSHAIHVALGYQKIRYDSSSSSISIVEDWDDSNNKRKKALSMFQSENKNKIIENLLGISLENILFNDNSNLTNIISIDSASVSSKRLLETSEHPEDSSFSHGRSSTYPPQQKHDESPLASPRSESEEEVSESILGTNSDKNSLTANQCENPPSESESEESCLSSSSEILKNEHGKELSSSLLANHSSTPFSSTPQPSSQIDHAPDHTQKECMLSASHYFPIAQYVTSHFGRINSGVTFMENILLSDYLRDLVGHLGENDEVNEFYEVEAEAGNVNAQLMMAKKYFWGHGGLKANVDLARRWFERAAAQNNPEGLYNMGVFHNEGMAGFTRNTTMALSYFKRSADHHQPFLLALHAMGNHYLGITDMSVRNVTLARHYFEKAAQADAPDAHYSLSTIYKDGVEVEKDIHRSVRHLAVAASLGHLRAINSLAHSLYDAESWLGAYARQQARLRNTNSTISSPGQNNKSNNNNLRMDANISQSTLIMPRPRVSTSYQWLKDSDSKEPLVVILPNKVVELPSPLGPSCEAALPLLKHIAEHMHRTNDLTRKALSAYVRGSLWESLELYEEAADLGVEFAQANAVFLYEKIKRQECQGNIDYGSQVLKYFLPSTSISFMQILSNQTNTTYSTANYTTNSPSDTNSNLLSPEDCAAYMDRMVIRRRLQLSQSGDLVAMSSLADKLLFGSSVHLPRNTYEAAQLYGMAAERGSSQSLVSIGWIFAFGLGGFPLNITAASLLFSTAFRWETYSEIDRQKYAFADPSTNGVAPAIGLLYVYFHGCLQKISETALFVIRFCVGNTPPVTIDNLFLQKFYGVDDILIVFLLSFLFLLLLIIKRCRRVRER